MGLSHGYSPDGLNNTLLSQATSLKWLLVWAQGVECTLEGKGRGEAPPMAQVQLAGQPTVTSS